MPTRALTPTTPLPLTPTTRLPLTPTTQLPVTPTTQLHLTEAPPPRRIRRRVPAAVARVDFVLPVFNEAETLAASVRELHDHLTLGLPFSWRIVIANNASTDATPAVAAALAADLPDVAVLDLPEKGRGRALRAAWMTSDAEVLCYMDVDLSTDLRAILPLVAPLVAGHSDIAIGTRLAPGSRVIRSLRRELISRAYNRLLRTLLRARFSDAQCGFKAIRRDVARRLVPAVRDDGWFFDTELLVLAQRSHLRIHEVPVDWIEDPSSSVDIVRTAREDLRGVLRLLLRRGARPPRSQPRLRASGSAAA
jgi:glycosyltransferase involved in cell wall biosynthesis